MVDPTSNFTFAFTSTPVIPIVHEAICSSFISLILNRFDAADTADMHEHNQGFMITITSFVTIAFNDDNTRKMDVRDYFGSQKTLVFSGRTGSQGQ